MLLPILALLCVLSSVQTKMVFDTVKVKIRTSWNDAVVFYTDETSASTTLGVSIPNSTFYTIVTAPRVPFSFIQDGDRDPACVNTVCPELIRIHTQYTKQADGSFITRLVKYDPKKATPKDDTFAIAGYLAPRPGYCGATDKPLLEFRSDILGSFAYEIDTSSKYYFQSQRGYYYDAMYQVMYNFMGYVFNDGIGQALQGTSPDYIVPGFESSVARTFYPLQELVQFAYKSNRSRKGYLGSPANVRLYYSESSNYTYDGSTTIRYFKYVSDVGLVRVKCKSNTTVIFEMQERKTGYIRLGTAELPLADYKRIGYSGVTLENKINECGATVELQEYQNKNDNSLYAMTTSEETTYSSDPKWQLSRRLGYVVPKNVYSVSWV